MRHVTVLGATGSIGENTLDVVARHPDRFAIHALVARHSVEALLAQCRRHRPRVAVLTDPAAARRLAAAVEAEALDVEVLGGEEAAVAMAAAPQADTVVAAVVGAAGLPSVLAAARAGKRILLANKEALVMAGPVFMRAVAEGGATLLPVDSEHNAIFQSLPAGYRGDPTRHGVRRVLLTASGGPFRVTPLERLDAVTPDEACAHPNWVMGRKISVDSATMMNKGLEVIEAHWLFGAAARDIEVVIHPQSVIHSMVEYADGSVLAQLGNPDMRTPIAQTLAYPERIEAGVAAFDIFSLGTFTFERPDATRFPCLRLAYAALEGGGTLPTALNAANEVAVEAFLAGRLPFTGIARLIEKVLAATPAQPLETLGDVLAADARARARAREALP
ncbi:MAG: 1-deoxy-D-xylulose-5-phosphate reductoisomerase [Burkholderiales bacterium]|nr:1-deoxy-D-xylulose-5-phosphate reductoisomerase [Burkholderiales bacterium]